MWYDFKIMQIVLLRYGVYTPRFVDFGLFRATWFLPTVRYLLLWYLLGGNSKVLVSHDRLANFRSTPQSGHMLGPVPISGIQYSLWRTESHKEVTLRGYLVSGYIPKIREFAKISFVLVFLFKVLCINHQCIWKEVSGS